MNRVLRTQRALGWFLSIATLLVTVTFFAMMVRAAELLARVVLGRSITLATVLAVAIILFYLAAIALFAVYSNRVDVLRAAVRGVR